MLLYQSRVSRSLTSATTSRNVLPLACTGIDTVAVESRGAAAEASSAFSPVAKTPAEAPSTSTSRAAGTEWSRSITTSASITSMSTSTSTAVAGAGASSWLRVGSRVDAVRAISSQRPVWGPKAAVQAVAGFPSSTAEARLGRSPARWPDDLAVTASAETRFSGVSAVLARLPDDSVVTAGPETVFRPSRWSITGEGAAADRRAVPRRVAWRSTGSGTARTMWGSGSERTGSRGSERSLVSTTVRSWRSRPSPRRSMRARGVRITSVVGPSPRSASAKPTGSMPG